MSQTSTNFRPAYRTHAGSWATLKKHMDDGKVRNAWSVSNLPLTDELNHIKLS